jgi:hypothetical protein
MTIYHIEPLSNFESIPSELNYDTTAYHYCNSTITYTILALTIPILSIPMNFSIPPT